MQPGFELSSAHSTTTYIRLPLPTRPRFLLEASSDSTCDSAYALKNTDAHLFSGRNSRFSPPPNQKQQYILNVSLIKFTMKCSVLLSAAINEAGGALSSLCEGSYGKLVWRSMQGSQNPKLLPLRPGAGQAGGREKQLLKLK